ncbi:interferon regulatory factor 3 isoform X2 [Antennarius striatus]|uniref:interferon regulatory factor 3 isoform X2 n=1 Tax=Antennarius striatus TaxID=241820 RepID=UPI0035B3329B
MATLREMPQFGRGTSAAPSEPKASRWSRIIRKMMLTLIKSFAGQMSQHQENQDSPDLVADIGIPTEEVVSCLDDCPYFADETVFTESTSSEDILQECLKGLDIGPDGEGTAGFEPPPEQQQLQNQVMIGACALPGQQHYPVRFEGAVGEAELPEQPAHPMEEAVGGAYLGQLFLHTMNKAREGDHFNTQFKILVYYRGVKVSEQLVQNEAGIRLVYRPELTETVLDPASGLSLVSLPSPGVMLDQTQISLTQRILDKLGGGLDLRVSGHVVYGQRWGETKAFWSFSKFDRNRQPREVSKLQPQQLYHFMDFVRGIQDFIEGRDDPPCSLFFCLGEKWPDPDNRPWVKKLITVEVVLTSMEILKTIAVEGGASSLQSVELQMSLKEMMEIS